MFHTKAVEKIRTHFMFNNFFWKLCHLWDNVDKCCRSRQPTDDNIIQSMHLACRIITLTDMLRIWNTYCLAMAIMVIQMNLTACLVQIPPFSLNF